MSKHKNRNRDNYIATEEVEETVDMVEETEPVFGMVVDCTKLNIRMTPNKTATVIDVVDRGDQLVIDLDFSTDEWYSVTTETGVEGFCMKQYVAIK